jgi:YidC/Oxa1 family membrane protein insertase
VEKRVVVLVILCVGVFVGWSFLMRAIYPPQPIAPAIPAPPVTPGEIRPSPPPGPPAPVVEAVQKDEPLDWFDLDNGKLKVRLTNKGAGVHEATVLVPDQKPMDLLKPFQPVPHLAVVANSPGEDTSTMGWTVAEKVAGKSITYQFKLKNGVVLAKKFSLEPGRNEIDVELTVTNSQPDKPQDVRLRMVALTGLSHDSPYRYDYYGSGLISTIGGWSRTTLPVAYDAPQPRPGTENQKNPPKVYPFEVPAEEQGRRQIEWVGLRNRYATVVLRSKEDLGWLRRIEFLPTLQLEGPEGTALKALAVEADLREARAVTNQAHLARFSLVLAPIRSEDLAAVPGGESHLLSYGCWGLFNPIGKFILWLIGIAYWLTHNYGWAIILTTLVIRLALFPLSKKSQVSMARMADLQPKLNVLRERYPDDQAKQQQETMKLFKEHGVNPLSGCLPILMQLPIFIGLYSVLDISLVFRHAPFLGWINDLSQPDRLIAFRQPINLWVTTIGEFNLVPIVMTVTWFLQAYYAPRPQDPKLAAQQRMMLFMPIVFGLLCYSLASGLSLYLFVNSLLAMIEQKIIKKYILPARPPSGPPAKA